MIFRLRAVVEVISNVHSPNYLRDFYSRFDLALHKHLVKPGGDYKDLLERAEEEHMKSLLEVSRCSAPTNACCRSSRGQPIQRPISRLQRIRLERARAREEAEDRGLGASAGLATEVSGTGANAPVYCFACMHA